MMETTISNPTAWGVIQYILLIAVGGLGFFLVRYIKSNDKIIEKLVDQVNVLSKEFLVVKTQHNDGWEIHQECSKKLSRIDALIEICNKRVIGD